MKDVEGEGDGREVDWRCRKDPDGGSRGLAVTTFSQRAQGSGRTFHMLKRSVIWESYMG